MSVQLLDEAELDLVDGFCFYEAQQAGLGDYFLDSLFSDIDSLQLFAGIHRRHLGFYRLLSKRFPFAIYYRIEGKVVNVHAVMDCRQNPERIRERLE
jgi:plasmid stabilization system protein ParE